MIGTVHRFWDYMHLVAIDAHPITHPQVTRDLCRCAAARANGSMGVLRDGRTATSRTRWLRSVLSSWRHNHLNQQRTRAEKNESRNNRYGVMHHRALSLKMAQNCVLGLTAQTTEPLLLLLGGGILPPLFPRPQLPRRHRRGYGWNSSGKSKPGFASKARAASSESVVRPSRCTQPLC